MDKLAIDMLKMIVSDLGIDLTMRLEATANEFDARSRVLRAALRSNTIDVSGLLELERESGSLIIDTIGANLKFAHANTLHLWRGADYMVRIWSLLTIPSIA